MRRRSDASSPTTGASSPTRGGSNSTRSPAERLCRLFYCDPGNSGQKGKIEKNHVELRKVFPKGTLFSAYVQGDVDLALSHINSEPRAVLNRRYSCPGDVAKTFIDPEVIGLNNYRKIKPDEVKLHPDLLGK